MTKQYTEEEYNKAADDLWDFLNECIADGTDVYQVAIDNNMLRVGQTRAYFKRRGGAILYTIADGIIKNPELKSLFKPQ